MRFLGVDLEHRRSSVRFGQCWSGKLPDPQKALGRAPELGCGKNNDFKAFPEQPKAQKDGLLQVAPGCHFADGAGSSPIVVETDMKGLGKATGSIRSLLCTFLIITTIALQPTGP